MSNIAYIVTRDIDVSRAEGRPYMRQLVLTYNSDERDKAFIYFDNCRSYLGDESVRIYEVKDISNDVPVLPENRPPV